MALHSSSSSRPLGTPRRSRWGRPRLAPMALGRPARAPLRPTSSRQRPGSVPSRLQCQWPRRSPFCASRPRFGAWQSWRSRRCGDGAVDCSAARLGVATVACVSSPLLARRCLRRVQGITTNLLELAWKHYLHRLASTPAAYSAFLGDTAMWTGIVTGGRCGGGAVPACVRSATPSAHSSAHDSLPAPRPINILPACRPGTLMFASPMLFDRVGWRGVASATPTFMLWAGLPFFAGCLAFNWAGERGGLERAAAHAAQRSCLAAPPAPS